MSSSALGLISRFLGRPGLSDHLWPSLSSPPPSYWAAEGSSWDWGLRLTTNTDIQALQPFETSATAPSRAREPSGEDLRGQGLGLTMSWQWSGYPGPLGRQAHPHPHRKGGLTGSPHWDL